VSSYNVSLSLGFVTPLALRLRYGRTVDVNEGEVAALVARGYLPEEACGDPVAIKAAIEIVISDLAFELEQERSKGSGSRF